MYAFTTPTGQALVSLVNGARSYDALAAEENDNERKGMFTDLSAYYRTVIADVFNARHGDVTPVDEDSNETTDNDDTDAILAEGERLLADNETESADTESNKK